MRLVLTEIHHRTLQRILHRLALVLPPHLRHSLLPPSLQVSLILPVLRLRLLPPRLHLRRPLAWRRFNLFSAASCFSLSTLLVGSDRLRARPLIDPALFVGPGIRRIPSPRVLASLQLTTKHQVATPADWQRVGTWSSCPRSLTRPRGASSRTAGRRPSLTCGSYRSLGADPACPDRKRRGGWRAEHLRVSRKDILF
jgi:hypothetical protein